MNHPSVEDLVERSDHPDVAGHLAGCASCRARARLLRDLDGSEPGPPALDAARRRGLDAVSSLTTEPGSTPPPGLPPGRVVDRWVVEERLGAGAMGTVYRVRHLHLGSRHALKVLHPTPRRRADLREGRAQGLVHHPNVVGVTDVVDVDGSPGLVLEWVEGPTLAAHLRGGLPGAAEIDAVARSLLDGVAAAHRVGLVHRDLKPGNVLLARAGAGWVAKVADFGLALAPTGDDSLTGAVGTPSYCAPEQIRDARTADARSDVFSLGAVLFELVTGQRAFPGTSAVEVHDAIRAGRRRRVRELAPHTPARQVDAIERALSVDPADRFPDAAALRRAWDGDAADAARPARGATRAWVAGAIAAAVVVSAVPALRATRAPVSPPPAAAAPAEEDRRITARPADQQLFGLAVSPDGAEVAWGDARGLRRQRLDGGDAVTLVDQGPFHDVDWLPDGQLLAHGTWDGVDGVWRLDREGHRSEPLATGMIAAVRAAPAGDRFALADASGLWVQELATPTRRLVRPLPGRPGLAALTWSPSGRQLAAVLLDDTGPRLEVVDVASGEARTLSTEPGLVALSLASLAWIAPDRLIYGVADRKDRTWRALDGASTASSTAGSTELRRWRGWDVTHTDPTPDGRALVHARVTSQVVPYLADLADRSARRLSHEEWDQWPLAWTDDRTVRALSSRGGGEVVALPLDGGPGRSLRSGDWVSRREDRVGDAWIRLSLREDGVDVVREDHEGTRVLAALPGDGAPSKRWTLRCRARCLLSENRGDGVRFAWLDPQSGATEPVEVPGGGEGAWDLAPDGRHLALASAVSRLVVRDLVTGEGAPWPSTIHTPSDVAWSADGEAVFVAGLTWQSDAYRIDEVRRDGSRVVWASPSWFLYRPTPSPDGRHLAFAASVFDDDVWISPL